MQVCVLSDSVADSAGSELPPDYAWDEWTEDSVQEEATYFELEDEQEEARRDGVSGTDAPKKCTKKPAKPKGYLIKCHECPSKFNSLENYIKHRAGHGMKGNIVTPNTCQSKKPKHTVSYLILFISYSQLPT